MINSSKHANKSYWASSDNFSIWHRKFLAQKGKLKASVENGFLDWERLIKRSSWTKNNTIFIRTQLPLSCAVSAHASADCTLWQSWLLALPNAVIHPWLRRCPASLPDVSRKEVVCQSTASAAHHDCVRAPWSHKDFLLGNCTIPFWIFFFLEST